MSYPIEDNIEAVVAIKNHLMNHSFVCLMYQQCHDYVLILWLMQRWFFLKLMKFSHVQLRLVILVV